MESSVRPDLLCIFSLVHNSALVQANTLAWLLGAGSGLLIAGIAGSRLRHVSPGREIR